MMQELTPLDIQKQAFRKKFSGFDPEEVRAYLHVVAEEIERQLKEIDRLTRENYSLREELLDFTQREQILKETLLAAQKICEDMKVNARKEAEIIVKDAELLSERIISQAMTRVGELEGTIQDMKLQRRSTRSKLQITIDNLQHLVSLDADQEATELPLTQLYRKMNE